MISFKIKVFVVLLLTTFLYKTGYSQLERTSKVEFNRAIIDMERKFFSLEKYVIDTSGIYWSATDPFGYFSFEGYRNIDSNIITYNLKMKSFIYSDNYFNEKPDIRVEYYFRNKKHFIPLNFGSESFYDDFPFKFKDIKVVYFEKIFSFSYSETLIFDRLLFEENYVVTFKDGSTKNYTIDPIKRDFFEVR